MVYNEFIVRVPAFPLEYFININNQSSGGQQVFIDVIKQALNDIRFKRALFFASKDLYELIPKFLSDQMKGKDALKYGITIYKYLSRASSRPTPFGAFAGIDVGKLGDRSIIDRHQNSDGRLRVRLDTVVETYLLNEILSEPKFSKHIEYALNNTIYRVKNRLRYFEKRVSDDKVNYVISSVPADEHIVFMIEHLPMNFRKAVFFDIMSKFSDSQEELDDFFNDLIESGFILPESQHYLTGKDMLTHLQDLCGSMEDFAKPKLLKLKKIRESINEFNTGEQNQDRLSLNVKGDIPDTTIKNFFQVDLDINFKQFILKNEVLIKLANQLKQLASKMVSRRPNERLRTFIIKFRERFGDNEVPLLLAIDPEVGISYDDSESLVSPLLDGLELYFNSNTGKNTGSLDWFKNKLAQQSVASGFKEYIIDDEDLTEISKTLESDPTAVDDDFYVLGSIICKSTEELDKGNYLFDLKSMVYSSAAKLGSRFSHLKEDIEYWNKNLCKLLNKKTEDTIYAEIVHLSDYAGGNVLKRPSLSDFEIPFFASASVPVDRRVNLKDLYVSLRNGSIILTSRSLNKIVIPRLTSAHNFRKGIPLYQFLCDLQQKDITVGINNSFNIPGGSIFFPRIRHKKLILNKATWRLSKDDIKSNTIEEFNNFFLDFKKMYHLPKFVTMSESDNEMLIDTENWLSTRIIFENLVANNQTLLTEFLYADNGSPIGRIGETYTNEILFQVLAKENGKMSSHQSIRNKDAELFPTLQTKRFFPGDKWLYIKVYSGPKVLDDILINEFAELISTIRSDREDVQFFFIRYCDPSDHLRLRICCEDLTFLYEKVLSYIRSIFFPLTTDNTIYKIQFDTYEQELIRYGRDIDLSERVFFADSILCLKSLSFLKKNNLGEDTRVYLGILIMKGYLNEFFTSQQEKYAFCKYMKESYYTEYSGIQNLKTILAKKLRYYREVISDYVSREDYAGVREAFQNFIAEKNKYVKGIPFYGQDRELLKSYIHMSVNRLFSERQRLHELFLYDFLEKEYLSTLKREIKKQANEI